MGAAMDRASLWADMVKQRQVTNALLRRRRYITDPRALAFVPVPVTVFLPELGTEPVTEHVEPVETV